MVGGDPREDFKSKSLKALGSYTNFHRERVPLVYLKRPKGRGLGVGESLIYSWNH